MMFGMQFFGIIYILSLIAMVWVIYDVIKSPMPNDKKIIWIVLAILFSIITAVIYYIIEKN